MASTIALLIAITAAISERYLVVEGTPIGNSQNGADLQSFGGPRILTKNGRFIRDLPISWSLPTFPSISVSSLFRNDDKEWKDLKKRVESLEKSHKKILDLLKKLNEALTLNEKETTPSPHQSIEKTNTTTYSETSTDSPNNTESVSVETENNSQINSENENTSDSIRPIDLDDEEQRRLTRTQNKTKNLGQRIVAVENSENIVYGKNSTLIETGDNEENVPVTELENETTNSTTSLTQQLKPDDVPNGNISKPLDIVPQAKTNHNVRFEEDEITFENGYDRKLKFPDF